LTYHDDLSVAFVAFLSVMLRHVLTTQVTMLEFSLGVVLWAGFFISYTTMYF